MRTLNGAEVLCHALMEEGVELLFGYPGGAILPFYDALHRTPSIRHVLMRHEQAAAHAADGFARATGKVGVVVATSGPGATNLVTGLATALADSVPLVAITGQVPLGVMGSEAFQETDILGATMPVTKHGFLVENPDDIPDILATAFRMAVEGRPGPILIDIPKDVQARECRVFPFGRRQPRKRVPTPSLDGGWSEALLDEAAELLNEASRPVVMVGRGVVLSGVEGVLAELAEKADLPVITTLLGLDAFPPTHELNLGMPGMHGTERANQAIQTADVILGLGLRFDDRVTGPVASFAPKAEIIHLDIDPVTLGRTVRPRIPIVGNLKDSLPPLAERIRHRANPGWWATLGGWAREAEEESWDAAWLGPLSGRQATRGLAARIKDSGALVATDVGQHQMWLAQEFKNGTPGTHLTSGGLGTMGYALPAAIGAALGCPEKAVWVVAGDGGFQMNVQELATVAQEGLPLKIAIVNNGVLGMVRQWQDLFYQGRLSASKLSGPDLVTLAAAYGIPASRVWEAKELEGALDQAEATPGPCLLDLRIAAEEMVFPMVPPGSGIQEMVHKEEMDPAS
jgi:acetolactate synthase-1/2/3 large subunit